MISLTDLAHHTTLTASQTFFQDYSLNNYPPADMKTKHRGPVTSCSNYATGHQHMLEFNLRHVGLFCWVLKGC